MRPPARRARINGSSMVANGEIIGVIKKLDTLAVAGIVNRAQVYAPTAMKPAWPRTNRPVKPFIRLRLKPRII